MTREEGKQDIGCVVDLGRGCGVCTSVELKGGPFIRLELGGSGTRAQVRWSRLGE